MSKQWAFYCLGVEPRIYGPYESELEADENVEQHAPFILSGPPETSTCDNGVAVDDHGVLEMRS